MYFNFCVKKISSHQSSLSSVQTGSGFFLYEAESGKKQIRIRHSTENVVFSSLQVFYPLHYAQAL